MWRGGGAPFSELGRKIRDECESLGFGGLGSMPSALYSLPPPPKFPSPSAEPPPSPSPLLISPPPPVRWRWAACDRSCLSSLPTRPCSRTGWQRRPRGWPTARRHSTAPPGTSRGCRCGVHTTGPHSLSGGLSPWWAFYTHSIVAIALCRMSHTDHAYHMNALELASVPMGEAPGSHT